MRKWAIKTAVFLLEVNIVHTLTVTWFDAAAANYWGGITPPQ